MPMTRKGKKIMTAMQQEYGGAKGERVYHAMRNAGKLTGVEMPKHDDDAMPKRGAMPKRAMGKSRRGKH